MKNLRAFYLAVFLAAAIFTLFTSFDVAPEAKVFKIGNWVFGINLGHNLVIKVIGFVALFLYLVTPKLKK